MVGLDLYCVVCTLLLQLLNCLRLGWVSKLVGFFNWLGYLIGFWLLCPSIVCTQSKELSAFKKVLHLKVDKGEYTYESYLGGIITRHKTV